MERTARCSCGALSVKTQGEPALVLACHCTECQRRTGAAFGIGAYFLRAAVKASGRENIFDRPAPDSRRLRNHFCPVCGSTVYWETDLLPDSVGIAVGAFNDPDFPKPQRSVWECSRQRWLYFGADIPGHLEGRSSTPVR